MQWLWYLLSGIILVFPLAIMFYFVFVRSNGTNQGRNEFAYQVKKQKLLDVENISTFLIPFLISIIFFIYCVREGVFFRDFTKVGEPVLYLIPKSLISPTTLIAVLGPTILALNYRLFKGHIADLDRRSKDNNYGKIHSSNSSRFVDAQFDHSHQLNTLVIAWSAFAYQIVFSPILSIIRFHNTSYGSDEIDKCLKDTCGTDFKFGQALNEVAELVKNDFISLFIIILAFGFVVWTFIRLISGQLSTIDIVELYEKDDDQKLTYPTIASRITIYRYILILFSYLYLVWSDYYLMFRSRKMLSDECGLNATTLKQVNNALDLPSDDSGNPSIYFVLFIFFFVLTLFVGRHYLSNFKYILSTKKNKTKINSEIDLARNDDIQKEK